LARHYAPRTPLECVEAAASRLAELLREGKRIGWVTLATNEERPGVVVVSMPNDPAGYAARVYAALHEFDQAGLDRIGGGLATRYGRVGGSARSIAASRGDGSLSGKRLNFPDAISR